MRKKTLVSVIGCLVLAAPGLFGQVRKYDVKSGVISFETRMDMGGMEMVTTHKVTFDDYGMKERKDSYEDGQLKESFFSDGQNLYLLIFKDNTAYNRGKAYRGTEYRFSWEEVAGNNRADVTAKKLADITILGRNCESFELTTKQGPTVFAGWKGICLKTDVKMQGMRVITQAMSFDENVTVPSDTFKVPSGMQLK